jgi:uncharacterized protein (TIGR03086 family)
MADFAPTELLALFQRAQASFTDRVDAVKPEQWDDGALPGWTVADLVAHLVSEALWTPPLLAGEPADLVDGRFPDDTPDLLGDDPLTGWETAADGALAAFAEDRALLRTVHLQRGPTSAAEYIEELTADLTVHSWDLARATGRRHRPRPGAGHRLPGRGRPAPRGRRAGPVRPRRWTCRAPPRRRCAAGQVRAPRLTPGAARSDLRDAAPAAPDRGVSPQATGGPSPTLPGDLAAGRGRGGVRRGGAIPAGRVSTYGADRPAGRRRPAAGRPGAVAGRGSGAPGTGWCAPTGRPPSRSASEQLALLAAEGCRCATAGSTWPPSAGP